MFFSRSDNHAQGSGEASQAKGKRKRQIDPQESKREPHNTQSGDQVVTVRVSTPSKD